MQQVLHLLLVDADRRAALASRHGARWLLPVVCCAERTRAGPLMGRWAAERGISAPTVGQWLGRVDEETDAADWLVVMTALSHSAPSFGMSWIPLQTLRSNPSLIEYQEWAVRKAMIDGDLPAVAGPFGAVSWISDVTRWIEQRIDAIAAAPVVIYRASPYEVVLGTSAGGKDVYFKGLAGGRAAEASLTCAVSSLIPESFARTLALEVRPDGTTWWLAAGCPGVSLARALRTDCAALVGAALFAVQGRLSAFGEIAGRLPRLPIAEAEAWSVRLLGAESPTPRQVACSSAALRDAWAAVRNSHVAERWIPMDLDPANVLLASDHTVRFIDIDGSYLGPAPLAVATLARRMERMAPYEEPPSAALCRAYGREWEATSGSALDVRPFKVVSAVLETCLGWQRLLTNTAHGEVYGAIGPARRRLAHRLARAVVAQTGGSPRYRTR